MPEYLPGTNIPIPLPSEAAVTPADMKRAFLAVNTSFLLHVKNEGELTSKYPDVPVGTVATGTEQNAMWYKTVAGTWSKVWSDSGWKNVTILSGWGTPQPLQYRVIGSMCYWRGVLQAPSGAQASTEYPICNVPSEAQPTITTIWSTNGRNSTNVVSLNITSGVLRGYIGTPTSSYLGVPSPYLVD